MKFILRNTLSGIACAAGFLLAAHAEAQPLTSPSPQADGGGKFEVSFPAAAHAEAITGRVFVMISAKDKPEPRLVAGSGGDSGVLFGA
ncbi:MAG: hypothetical protein ABSH39_09055, partial [Candidatus Acidiferrum sp.]